MKGPEGVPEVATNSENGLELMAKQNKNEIEYINEGSDEK